MLKFLRKRAVIILIAVMAILCLIAAVVSVEVSITMMRKRDLVSANKPVYGNKDAKSCVKPANMNKAAEQEFYLNGEKISDINGIEKAYWSVKKEILLPFDSIMQKMNFRIKPFYPDDIMETEINDEKLSINFATGSFTISDNPVVLPVGAVTANSRIFVPAELFDRLKGFKTDVYTDSKTVFLNYFPVSGFLKDSKTMLLKHTDNSFALSNLKDGKVSWNADMDPGAVLSADGMYLYWNDEANKKSYAFDLIRKTTLKSGDYYFRIKQPSYLNILYEYKQGKSYKRITFTDTAADKYYSFIERNGRVVIEGELKFSPDRKKVLYYKKDKGYYIANSDGTKITFLENGSGAVWVNNNKLLLDSKGVRYLFDKNGKKTVTENEWKEVGQASDGSVFFLKDNTLYCETGNTEKQLFELPWNCDYVHAASSSGPYVILSNEIDSIFYVDLLNHPRTPDTGDITAKITVETATDKTTEKTTNKAIEKVTEKTEYETVNFNGISAEKIGKYSMLQGILNRTHAGSAGYPAISESPDNSYFSIILLENGFVKVSFIDIKSGGIRKITLNCPANDELQADPLKQKWIAGDRLLLYTGRRGWVIDLKDNVKIYDWTETEGSSIAGCVTPN